MQRHPGTHGGVRLQGNAFSLFKLYFALGDVFGIRICFDFILINRKKKLIKTMIYLHSWGGGNCDYKDLFEDMSMRLLKIQKN